MRRMRMAALVAAMMMTVMSSASTLDVSGKVIDENGDPMPYVNVVLLSLPDSAFVQGNVTDEQGMFRIVTNKNDGLLKLSCMGYETQYVKIHEADGMTFQMSVDSRMLSEVVV